MATSSGILKDCTHIAFNETIKSHNNVTFKLVKTGESQQPILFYKYLNCNLVDWAFCCGIMSIHVYVFYIDHLALLILPGLLVRTQSLFTLINHSLFACIDH